MTWLTAPLILFVVILLSLGASPARAELVSAEVARVHDGDTLTLSDGTKIRLFGIDTPELKQKCLVHNTCLPCGDDARKELQRLATGTLICERRGTSYDRVVARCVAGDVDLAEAMIGAGRGTVYGRYIAKRDPLRSQYLDAESRARREKRGIWAGDMIGPERWRRGDRLECER